MFEILKNLESTKSALSHANMLEQPILPRTSQDALAHNVAIYLRSIGKPGAPAVRDAVAVHTLDL